jgi:glutathione S-transferase
VPEIILHHYEMSPFSEKIRRILGHKNMAWRGVDAPMMNPKPKLVALTGGYRRIPVLQIGADVYCDTSIIARVLERVQPEPTIFPDGREAEATLLAQWADRQLFIQTVPIALAAAESFLTPELKADREAMAPQMQFDRLKEAVPDARNQIRALLHYLGQLLEGRPFLLGERFSLADAAVYNPIWFLQNAPDAKGIIHAHPPIVEWFERCGALGRGKETPLDADEALSIARDAKPATVEQGDPGDPNGARPGDRVTILPDDYAFDPIEGRLVALDALEMAVRREAPEVGEVVVHFPRVGYRILPASP